MNDYGFHHLARVCNGCNHRIDCIRYGGLLRFGRSEAYVEREGVQCVNNTIAGEVEGASVDIYPTKKRGQEKCVVTMRTYICTKDLCCTFEVIFDNICQDRRHFGRACSLVCYIAHRGGCLCVV